MSNRPIIIVRDVWHQNAAMFTGDQNFNNPSGHWDVLSLATYHLNSPTLVWWHPPPKVFKINFDTIVSNQSVSTAFITWNFAGRLIAAGGQLLADLNVPQAELVASWLALKYAVYNLLIGCGLKERLEDCD